MELVSDTLTTEVPGTSIVFIKFIERVRTRFISTSEYLQLYF